MAMVNPAANPMQMLEAAMKMRQQPQPDPRAAAVEQYMQQQGNQSRMPTVTPDDLMSSQMAGPGTQDDQGQQLPDPNGFVDTMRGSTRGQFRQPSSPEEDDIAEQDAEDGGDQSDEEMLDHIQNGISPQGDAPQMRGKDPRIQGSDDPANWPDTPEEFEKMFGRAPATDSEMQFYYGGDGGMGDRGMTYPSQRQPNMPPSRRFESQRE